MRDNRLSPFPFLLWALWFDQQVIYQVIGDWSVVDIVLVVVDDLESISNSWALLARLLHLLFHSNLVFSDGEAWPMPHSMGLWFLHLYELTMVELSLRTSHHLVEVTLVGWRHTSVHWRELLYLDDVGIDVPIVNNWVILRQCFGGMLNQGVQRLLDVVLLPNMLQRLQEVIVWVLFFGRYWPFSLLRIFCFLFFDYRFGLGF